MSARRERRAGRPHFFLVSWALLTVLYWLLVFKTELTELIAGVICGAISAFGADLVRRHGSVRIALHDWGFMRAVVALPRHTLRDTVLLARVVWRVLVRREVVEGHFLVQRFPDAHGRGPEAAGRRAMAKLVGSVAPNTLVVGFADNKDLVLLHQLVDTGEPPPCDPWEEGW